MKIIWYKTRLLLSNSENLRKTILPDAHDSVEAGHMGQEKTIELVRRIFFWLQMD